MSDGYVDIQNVSHLREALSLLGSLLEATGSSVAIAVVGGSALLLDGLISRVTHDVDVVAFVVDGALSRDSQNGPSIERSASSVALELGLEPQWLNLGPVSLLDGGLPKGSSRGVTSNGLAA